ncbi:MAG: ABC transporter permease subunit [Acholeplasma sp.]|nr:ABC transporter permease subunit [Acholeplasma sp.]
MRKIILGALSISILILIWFSYSKLIANEFILPGPIKVIKTTIDLLFLSSTYKIILWSLFRLFISFVLSAVSGTLLGLMAGNFNILDELLKPLVSALRSLPIASIIIIIMILFGRNNSLYIITFLMIFPLVYEASKSGVQNIDQALKDNIALETHSTWILLYRVQLPLSLPFIRTSLFQSIGLGFKVIVMAEFITQAKIGIGRELFDGSISIQYDLVFAWTILLIILVIIFESILRKIKTVYEN